jgi:hypothetical protein
MSLWEKHQSVNQYLMLAERSHNEQIAGKALAIGAQITALQQKLSFFRHLPRLIASEMPTT